MVGSPILLRDLGGHSGERRRTYDVFAARLRRAGGSLAGAVGVNLDEGPGLVATQTLTFLFADIEGSAAMSRRLEDAYTEGRADQHRVLRAWLLRDALPAGVWLTNLGQYWLPGEGRAGQVFQLRAAGLPAGFLPPRSLEGVRQC